MPGSGYKSLAFALGAFVAGLGGSLLAHQYTYVSPDMFGVLVSVLALTIVVAGGMASVVGAVAGAVVLVGAPELFRPLAGDPHPRVRAAPARHDPLPAPGAAGQLVSSSARGGPLLEVRDLARPGGVRAVDGVSFRVEAGETIGLIGPNGSGKTTVFNLVSGLLWPQAGEVVFAGEAVTGRRPEEIAERDIGRTFQNGRVFGNMSVEENLLVGAHRPPRGGAPGGAVAARTGRPLGAAPPRDAGRARRAGGRPP